MLLREGPLERNRALDDIRSLGADAVRSLVVWRDVAPRPARPRRPRGFRAADPAAYPAAAWDRYDDLVRGAHVRGLGVILSPTAPMPAWASECRAGPLRMRRVCRPRVRDYGAFVRALGRRYSGAYADENQGGGVLPRVGRWSIWNEPNQAGWLYPQSARRGGRRIAFAAHRYRALSRAAIAALRATGHGSDDVLLGETAPIGWRTGARARRPTPPVDFIRELLCLNRRNRPQGGAAARAAGCRRPGRLRVTGYAHHPYTRGGSQPPTARTVRGEITIATAGRLKSLLAAGQRARRIPRRLPILYTEYGFQTNPPDRLFGVSLRAQAGYINQSDWIAYRDPRVRAVAQYKLVDEQDVASFQTGLRFVDGRRKPAWNAYRLPIWVSRSGRSHVRVYGQVRPAADHAREQVVVEVDPGGGFEPVATVDVGSPKGHFVVRLPVRKGSWRLRWTPSNGSPSVVSRVARAAPR